MQSELVHVTDNLIPRKLSNSLWSNLMALLEQILFNDSAMCESTVAIICSIPSVVAYHTYHKSSAVKNPRLEQFFHSAIYSLVFIGLLLSEWPGKVPPGNGTDFALIDSMFNTTSSYLCATLGSKDLEIINRIFDEASLNCFGMHSKQVSALSEWNWICC
jgi:hypothetical protein